MAALNLPISNIYKNNTIGKKRVKISPLFPLIAWWQKLHKKALAKITVWCTIMKIEHRVILLFWG